jgi:N-acetylglucosaminyldiphosphoundecaprenol N-acetyl-beta-D-mannosaminyltransferase
MNDNLKRGKIMDVPVDLVNKNQALEKIKNAVTENKKLHVVTVNAEMIMLTREDSDFGSILKNAGLIIPDGSGVIWALRNQGIKLAKLPGIELALSCIQDTGARVFLLGGQEETIKLAYDSLVKSSPGHNIAGYRNGYFKDEEDDKIIDQINALNPDILLIGLGVPRQEKWINRNINKINASVFIGVGGSFDVFSGKIKRAPLIMRKLHLEWLYRLYKEPWRWRRMLALPRFVGAVYRDRKSVVKGEK